MARGVSYRGRGRGRGGHRHPQPQPQSPLPPPAPKNKKFKLKLAIFLCFLLGVALKSFFLSVPSLETPEDFSSPFLRNDDEFRRENAKFYTLRSVKLKLGLVFTHLIVDPYQDLMINFALSLKEIGHEFQVVLSLEDGPVSSVWRNEGISVSTIDTSGSLKVDWLNYDAVFLNSFEAMDILSCLMQEPFKSVPVIWTVSETALAGRLKKYNWTGQKMLVDSWRKVFRRANAVVFPNYDLAIAYSICDTGNYFVIPEFPIQAEEDDYSVSNSKIYAKMGCGPQHLIIAIVGSQRQYKYLWVEQALVLQALMPVVQAIENLKNPRPLKIIVFENQTSFSWEADFTFLLNQTEVVKQVAVSDELDAERILRLSDIVIYASVHEEQSFPYTLLKAMLFGKPIVAPDLLIIKKHEDIKVLTDVMARVVSNGKLSRLAQDVAFSGEHIALNLMVSKSIEGYALILENIMPPGVEAKSLAVRVPKFLVPKWKWLLSETVNEYVIRSFKTHSFLNKFEKQFNPIQTESSMDEMDHIIMNHFWDEEKDLQIANSIKEAEEEELEGRNVQRKRGTWEEISKLLKKAERFRKDLHEREYGELERKGQPLCIYEPYYGEGTWPFLHNSSLYRGLGLSTKGRRPEFDDIDAPSRLPLLRDPYYRDVLGEYGGFFAIANRTGRIHKHPWIGFQSWRATARKESLSKIAETSLLEAIEALRYGDALFFWARMDRDPRNPQRQDFWSFCDAINAGNCQDAFSKAMKQMYGINLQNFSAVPPMPAVGGNWSVRHSWVLPTRSFLEFAMFSRMFVDALDSQLYDQHHQSGYCYLSVRKEDKHCYSRMLELVINVWAYHSARRMVYVEPKRGRMREEHKLETRRGKMWVKWFHYSTLKQMDEELAEVADIDPPGKRWLWPSTGEVVWQGILEREKLEMEKERELRKKQKEDKRSRRRKRGHREHFQEPLGGKYVKPPPETQNSTHSRLNH
nr:Phosphatidyl-myo-inositol mannosyltransferase [Ipomoea batatas]